MTFDELLSELRSMMHEDPKNFEQAAQLAMLTLDTQEERLAAAHYLNKLKTDEVFDATTHNGKITVQNPRTLGHTTFRIWTETWTDDKGNETKPRVVSLKLGSTWQAFAFATDEGIVVWKRFRDNAKYMFFAGMLNAPEKGEEIGLLYHIESRCRQCNRTLTNPESIRLGIGPICDGRNRR